MPRPDQRFAVWSPFHRALPTASDWHPTYEAARARAVDLATASPGLVFYVLEITAQAEFPRAAGCAVCEEF